LTQLINNTQESGEWPKKFIKVTIITLQNAVTICTFNLIAHTAKIVVRTLGIRIEREIEDVVGANQFVFRR